ncbi:MAG: hypothetical protein KF823_00225 [Xanthomonadales bacterium]|nr:hypothetical protein [Xanthomonadales bacterium]
MDMKPRAAWCRALFPATVMALTCDGTASAQSCQTPLPIITGIVQGLDTCQSANHLPAFGPVPSPHPDIVHVFEASRGLQGGIQVWSQAGAPPLAVVLLAGTCSAATAPLAAWDLAGGPAQIPASGWPAGPVYLVVTGDPGLPGSVCGAYQLTAEGLLVDRIFRTRFE